MTTQYIQRCTHFEGRYRNTAEMEDGWPEVTPDLVIRWEQENREDDKKRGSAGKFFGITCQRIWAGKVDMRTQEFQNVREVEGRTPFERCRFRLSTWRDPERERSVEIEMEWDLLFNCWTGRVW